MVVYYIKKESESLADYRYPIKEGDICMLYDGEVIKTVYIRIIIYIMFNSSIRMNKLRNCKV